MVQKLRGGKWQADGHFMRTSDARVTVESYDTDERYLHRFHEDRWATARGGFANRPSKRTAKDLYTSEGEPTIRPWNQSAERKLREMVSPVYVIFEEWLHRGV